MISLYVVDMPSFLTLLWSQDPPQPLCLLPSGPTMSRDLDQHIGIGKVKGVVADLHHWNASHNKCFTSIYFTANTILS